MTNVSELLDVEESGVEKAVCLVDNGFEEMNWYRGINSFHVKSILCVS